MRYFTSWDGLGAISTQCGTVNKWFVKLRSKVKGSTIQKPYLSKAPLAKDLEELEVVHGILAELGDGSGGGCDAAMVTGWLLLLFVQTERSIVLATGWWTMVAWSMLWRRPCHTHNSCELKFAPSFMLWADTISKFNITKCRINSLAILFRNYI